MRKKQEKEYQKGKIGSMVSFICENWKLDEKEVRKFLGDTFPELRDRSRCANCGESMAVYIYAVSVLDAQLVCSIAQVVTTRLQAGIGFTEANKIHLQREISDYTLVSRQTIASKLGLIAKVMTKDGKHDRKAGWSITRRGYDFLRGERVPKKVKVFHNHIEERFEETVTMAELYAENKSRSSDWQEIAGIFVAEFQKPRLL